MQARTDGEAARVALVTGAGKGLGRAFAEALAQDGACVVVNNRRHADEPSAADAVVDAIRGAGGQAVADYSDVRDPGAAEALIGRALETWGRLDAVVLNAGVNGPAAKIEALDPAEVRDVMEVNFFANVALAQAVIPHLKRSPAGRLLFVASTAGLHGVRGRAPYAASKGALIAFARTLAQELRRDGVGVNVLAPYATTRMTADTVADPRMAEVFAPEAAAPLAAYLAGPACTATDQVWVAGGGVFRRAETQEARGGGRPGETVSSAWIADNVQRLSAFHDGRGFPGAEAAFADLVAQATAHEAV
jgi:NAD(P)-dependent dehydrogenase (short-subunit alcohol dehydrogenase family)